MKSLAPLLYEIYHFNGSHFEKFYFIKIAQGWQLHTHQDIIMMVSNMNIQTKELY